MRLCLKCCCKESVFKVLLQRECVSRVLLHKVCVWGAKRVFLRLKRCKRGKQRECMWENKDIEGGGEGGEGGRGGGIVSSACVVCVCLYAREKENREKGGRGKESLCAREGEGERDKARETARESEREWERVGESEREWERARESDREGASRE